MVQEVSIEFKRRYCGVFLARLIIYNDIKERHINCCCRRCVVETSIKDTFGVVFTDINREEKSSKLTNTLSKKCTKQEVVGNFLQNIDFKLSWLCYR